jgi:hypothetical protein
LRAGFRNARHLHVANIVHPIIPAFIADITAIDGRTTTETLLEDDATVSSDESHWSTTEKILAHQIEPTFERMGQGSIGTE